jgi:uncharacterized protein (UPF0261 family)
MPERGQVATPTVVLLGTLDTKGPEHAYVRDSLRAAGVAVVLVDVGVQGEAAVTPDIPAEDVARAAGTTLEAVRRASADGAGRAAALSAMARGAIAVVADLRARGCCAGVMGMGGSGGSTIVSAALRSLPIGVPKLLVSTMAGGDLRPYVGTKDLTLVYPVTDIAGLNRVSRRVLANAANAMAGMVLLGVGSSVDPAGGAAAGALPWSEAAAEAPLVAITMMGVTTPGAQRVQALLEAAGFETMVFHANGSGGRAMEDLIDEGTLDGVVDLTTSELTSERFGGIVGAGPGRLTAAGRAGIPQLVSTGALDIANFGPRAAIPAPFDGPARRAVDHTPAITSVRIDDVEGAEMGRLLAEKVNRATGPTAVVLPLCGCSTYDLPGGPFVDPAGDEALFAAIRAVLRPGIACREVAANVNEPAFADAAVAIFLELWSSVRPLPVARGAGEPTGAPRDAGA